MAKAAEKAAEKAADDMSIFDPEPSDPSEQPAKKQGRSRGKKSTAPKHAAPAAEAPQEREQEHELSPVPAPKRAVVVKKEKDAVAAVESAVENAGESASFRPDKGALTKMTNVQIQAELVKRDFPKAHPPEPRTRPAPPRSAPREHSVRIL